MGTAIQRIHLKKYGKANYSRFKNIRLRHHPASYGTWPVQRVPCTNAPAEKRVQICAGKAMLSTSPPISIFLTLTSLLPCVLPKFDFWLCLSVNAHLNYLLKAHDPPVTGPPGVSPSYPHQWSLVLSAEGAEKTGEKIHLSLPNIKHTNHLGNFSDWFYQHKL